MTVSDLLGYASIGCWLLAQFPQILQNIKQQSCDGLALPFLANWFLGDFSNLVGCILTNQLPFQTWLATYFVSVDLVLVIQFFYYRGNKLPTPSFVQTRGRALSNATIRGRHPSRYRTLSVVAANVAAAAALAAQQEGEERGWSSVPEASDTHLLSPRHDDDETNDIPSAMTDSFLSEGGTRHKHVVWGDDNTRTYSLGRSVSRTTLPHHPMPPFAESPTTFTDPSARGRSVQRDVEVTQVDPSETLANRRSSRASKRGASMIFLSAFALFSIGSLTSLKQTRSVSLTGHVLSPLPVVPTPVSTVSNFPSADVHVHFVGMTNAKHPVDEPHHSPSSRDILGRIFAWLCTTLYFTSRLPQIWKNFVRKSVEGLSAYLFIFAFLGNVFYVSSILSSPQVSLPAPESTEFIRQSIPYLLGSGGTLMFDITIVSQMLIYRSGRGHQRRSSIRHRTVDVRETDEEARLLDHDPLTQSVSRLEG